MSIGIGPKPRRIKQFSQRGVSPRYQYMRHVGSWLTKPRPPRAGAVGERRQNVFSCIYCSDTKLSGRCYHQESVLLTQLGTRHPGRHTRHSQRAGLVFWIYPVRQGDDSIRTRLHRPRFRRDRGSQSALREHAGSCTDLNLLSPAKVLPDYHHQRRYFCRLCDRCYGDFHALCGQIHIGLHRLDILLGAFI